MGRERMGVGEGPELLRVNSRSDAAWSAQSG